MLKHLSVRNYTLINELEVDFYSGFSVVTGETGSGKSIMLGALGLLTGDRADLAALKNKEKKCVIEGVFEVDSNLKSTFFNAHDLDFEKLTVIRRELSVSGKSRAFINDTPVTLNQLKELGAELLDIHSQHQTILLNKNTFQADVLDAISGSIECKKKYLGFYKQYTNIVSEIERLKEKESQAIEDKNYFEFLLKDFEGIDFDNLNLPELENEFKLLEHAEEIKRISEEAISILDSENRSVLADLRYLQASLSKLSNINTTYLEFTQRIESVLFELSDISEDIAKKSDSIDVSEDQLEKLTELFDSIYRLQKKHNVASVEDLIIAKESIQVKLASVSSIRDEIVKLGDLLISHFENVEKAGEELSQKREKGAKILESEIKKLFIDLAMPNAEIKVDLEKLEAPSINGFETIGFLIKTNKGSSFEPLNKIASGGELSRIMLSIKTILSQSANSSTIIFDEIDTGVSGEVATKMAEIMQKIGNKMQVMSITHLPQIASKGSYHYLVEKRDSEKTTHTKIKMLTEEQRLLEIAKMLSGNSPSDAAILNAKELLNQK